MRWFNQWAMQLRMLFARRHQASRLDEELRDHLDRQIAENIAAGMNSSDARHAALRTFGNPALLREQTRATWSWNWLDSLSREVRFGARTLRRSPAFAVIAIVVMALGIGANVAMFTIVRSVLLKPLPFREPARLARLYESQVGDDTPFINVSGGMFSAWKRENKSFEDMALTADSEFNLSAAGGQLPENLHGVSCTWNFFSLLGVKPALGRDFTAADDQHSAQGTAILTWGLWKRRFGADPAIVNRTIRLNGLSYTIIGVLPAWFSYPDAETQLWTPVNHFKPVEMMESLGNHQFHALGRLRPGVTSQQAEAELSLIARHLHDSRLDNAFVGKSANILPLLDSMVQDVRQPLYVLLAATGCVLLIACFNVANLLVARSVARRKDLAIRSALGGGRLRLLREGLMESTLLCAIGGVLGLGLADAAIHWLIHTRPDLSRAEAIHIDSVAAAFAAALILFSALFGGLIASLGSTGAQLLTSLQDSSRGSSTGRARSRLRAALLTAEVGLTVVLLIVAGLLLKSYQRLRSSDIGCTTRNVLVMRLDLFGARYREQAQLVNFYSALLERVRALPGVKAAGLVQAVPGQGYWTDSPFSVVEHPSLPQSQAQFAISRWADPGYFAAMGIPFLQGHSFDGTRKLAQADQAVISASFAKQYLPGEDPIGKHLHSGERNYQIVGIVGDTRYALAESPEPIMYYPLYTGFSNNEELVLRSDADVDQLALPVQRTIQQLDHDLPVSGVMTMGQLLGKSAVDQSFNATLLTAFAGVSLLLAAVGLFGVLSYLVAQRTSEIGIRIALGAQRQHVLRKILLDGLKPALAGLVLGLAGSLAAARTIRSMLYETTPLDPWVFAAVVCALLLVATLACTVPAWRASRLDPMEALRTE